MIQFYYKRVIQGKKPWTEIPNLWRQDVCDLLVENGYVLNEDGTVSIEE